MSFNNVDITSSINVSCNITHQNINYVDNVELCFVKESLGILTPNTRINLVNLNNTIIDGFLARNQIIYYVPQFDHQMAQKLRMLTIETSKLKTITQNDLKPMINLESLDLTGNAIIKLENQTFKYNLKLIYINLTQNKIKFIGFGIFNNLQKLNRLYLHGNPCFPNGKNAKNQSEVAKLKTMLNSACKEKVVDGKSNNTDIKLPSTSKRRTTKKKMTGFTNSKGFTTISTKTNTTKNPTNPTTLTNIPKTATQTSNQTFKNESKFDLLTEPSQINSSSQSALVITLLSLILLILIAILILVIYCFISSSKSKARQTNIQQSQNARRISQMNTYDTLPQIKSENENRDDRNSIEMNQGTSEIYEDILDYQRSQDEIYQIVLDDICEEDSEEINEIGEEFTGIKTNYDDDDVYQTVNDELYQEVSIDNAEVVRNIEFSDDTYNNPEDFYDEVANDSKFNFSDDYQEVNQESSSKTDFLKQNVLGNASEFQVIEASLESEEDLYSESYVDAHQESMDDLYSTVKKN